MSVTAFPVPIETPEAAAPLVDVGAALAASREHSQLILCHLVAHQHATRLEVSTGLGGELLGMTRAWAESERGSSRRAHQGRHRRERRSAACRGYRCVAAADSGGDAHLIVLAGTRQAGGDLDQWVKDLNRSRLIGPR